MWWINDKVNLFFQTIILATYAEREKFCDQSGRCEIPKLTSFPDNSKVGEAIELELNDGRVVKRVKLGAKPKVYEIKNFLTEEECDLLIEEAKRKGMSSGRTERHERFQPTFFDFDHDGRLTQMEMRMTLENNFDVYFKPENLEQMYEDLKMDKNGDGEISTSELETISPVQLSKYLAQITEQQPWLKGRYSDNAFIFPNEITDPRLKKIVERVEQVTNTPAALMEKSDIQIVNYKEKGHYNLHLDTSRQNVPCCKRFGNGPRQCRSCRWLTMLFYLNDVEQGGETSFPVAEDETFDEQSFKMDLHLKCPRDKLLVAPEKGKAVFWFNHLDPNDDDDYVGEIDMFTHHGSCPVEKGEKWLANVWVKFSDDPVWDFTPLKKPQKQEL